MHSNYNSQFKKNNNNVSSKSLCMASIDYDKASDSVDISAVLKAINKHAVDESEF